MRLSARKKSQRGIKRSEAPCSEANNQRTTDAGAQSMSLAHYIEDGKLGRERAGSDLGDRRLVNFRSGFCRQLALAALEVLCAHVRARVRGRLGLIRIEKRYRPSSGSCSGVRWCCRRARWTTHPPN